MRLNYRKAPIVTSVAPAVGLTVGGTPVTIRGKWLGDVVAVRFGSVPASFRVVSDTEIIASAPAQGAGAVDVIVQTTAGRAVTTTPARFSYGDVPRVSAVSPASGLTVGGDSVVITGLNLSAATAVSFGDVETHFEVLSDRQQVTAVSPATGGAAGGTRVTIRGTNLSGALAVTFGKTTGKSLTVVSATELVVTAPAHAAGAVNVTVLTVSGASAAAAYAAFTYQ